VQVWQTCQATGDLLTPHHQPLAQWQQTEPSVKASGEFNPRP
jgi:hypothetical protein